MEKLERNNPGRWICRNEERVYHTPIMEVVRQDCYSSENPSKTHPFYVLRSRDWVNILPITSDGKVVMVRQYRVGISEHTLEVPGGVTDPTDPNPMSTALRELTEETGYAPLEGARCESLGWIHPNPAILDNKTHFFAVGPVAKLSEQKLDPGEMIRVEEVAIDQIPGLISNGTITHALTLNLLLQALLKVDAGATSLIQGMKRYSGN